MITKDIAEQLERIASVSDFAVRSAQVVDEWSRRGTGPEAVEPILRFIEEHPTVDFGMPGALVHFLERFYGKGYEEKLIESIHRRPTAHNLWMLNRVINGTKAPEARRLFISAMKEARLNPLADEGAIQRAEHFLRRLSS
jgi:hypothetical protein